MSAPEPQPPTRRPVLGLAHTVLFPHDVCTVEVTEPENLRALARMNALDGQIVAAPLREHEQHEAARGERFHPIGTLARVVSRVSLPQGGVRIVLQGLRRVALGALELEDGCAWSSGARVESVPLADAEQAARERARLASLLSALAEVEPAVSRELPGMIGLYGEDDERITDLVAALLPLAHSERACLLGQGDPARRTATLLHHLDSALVRARAGNALDGRVAERLRRRYLRAKLAELKDELGEPSAHEREIERFQERIEAAPLSLEARTVALRELDHLRRAAGGSQTAARLRGYLDWMLELPWPAARARDEAQEFEHVEERLSQSHRGLADVKRRIAEFLAVRQLRGSARGTVLCFLGPPGTGKSSMGRAVASALGRPLLNIPIGTITHEREIVGLPHERLSGSPGAILAGLHRVGAADPVILLDEIDKVSLGGEGHAAGALLSLLDPEQNGEFLDQYLGVPFDLSNCLFLATATDAGPIPEALLDRMETIEFAGYSEPEKYEIARAHLLRRAREYAGLQAKQLTVTPGALRALIRGYTEEAGVRQLQRHLISLARKAAVEVVRGGKPLSVRKEDLANLLGPRTVEEDLRVRRPAVGVTTGLAWTSAGGSLLPIEVIQMPGSGRLILTGSLGDVLRESVQTAVSYVRTFCSHLGLESNVLDNIDLHLHLPSAGTPKDGPSAGVAIATALVSLLTRDPARHDVAMTGEMSLLGQVLGVGGIREKLLAAIRAGVPDVILPRRNAEDCLRLDPEIRRRVRIHLIDDVREAFEIAICATRPVADETTIAIERTPRRRSAREGRDG
ncbi:MAG: endopeptidase La [Planctomycetes bacterium]|nr:endopeptidase La [Planctomycetota bacterium]